MSRKTFLLILALCIVVGVGVFVASEQRNGLDNGSQITEIRSFEECVAEGNPVMDSYPEQCRSEDGQLFVRNLPEDELENVITPITVEGTFVCLPHWRTSGPITLECAFGLLDDQGNHYVLRGSESYPDVYASVDIEERVVVEGVFIPGSHERYQSVGTIQVEEVTRLENGGGTSTGQQPQSPTEPQRNSEQRQPSSNGSEEEQIFCTMDARECPDGSFVGRVPPTCEFAPCPGN
jgi:hypothetical protein